MTTQLQNGSEHLTGRVKWFNNKAGYGFVSVTDGPHSDTDVFVHHSNINVDSQQYKYLVQGEYVEFELTHLENGKHEWQASNVSGIRGGKLMCETRRESKIYRDEYRTAKENVMPKQKHSEQISKERVKARGEGPRDNVKKEWTLLTNDNKSKQRQIHNQSRPKQGSTIITIESK
jgi:CspA family cold shock protein